MDRLLVAQSLEIGRESIRLETLRIVGVKFGEGRTDNGRSQLRAARIVDWTSSGVRQRATARGMPPAGLAVSRLPQCSGRRPAVINGHAVADQTAAMFDPICHVDTSPRGGRKRCGLRHDRE
jgi:hypothetical protein